METRQQLRKKYVKEIKEKINENIKYGNFYEVKDIISKSGIKFNVISYFNFLYENRNIIGFKCFEYFYNKLDQDYKNKIFKVFLEKYGNLFKLSNDNEKIFNLILNNCKSSQNFDYFKYNMYRISNVYILNLLNEELYKVHTNIFYENLLNNFIFSIVNIYYSLDAFLGTGSYYENQNKHYDLEGNINFLLNNNISLNEILEGFKNHKSNFVISDSDLVFEYVVNYIQKMIAKKDYDELNLLCNKDDVKKEVKKTIKI